MKNLLTACLVFCCSVLLPAAESKSPKFIKDFEESDRKARPPEGCIIFIGSSSFTIWKNLEKDMAPLPAFNRGFGGSQANQAVLYADQLVIAYKPSRVVFYEGDNDIFTGKSPEAFLEECKKFTAKVHAALPKTRIYFLSIKPSPSRAGKLETYKQANALLRAYTATDPRLAYICLLYTSPSPRD